MGYLAQLIFKPSHVFAEFVGAFLLVLIGTSAITAVNIAGQASSPLVILINTLAFSVSLAILTYHLSKDTLAQFNPATTLLLWLNQKVTIGQAITNMLSQLLGAIVASISVGLLYGSAGVEIGLGSPQPVTNMGQIAAFVAELIGSLILFTIIQNLLNKSVSPKTIAWQLGLAFAMAAIFATGISGASFNPVRSLAPQLASSMLTNWMLYVAAPLLAALAIGLLGRLFNSQQSQQSATASSVTLDPVAAVENREFSPVVPINDVIPDPVSPSPAPSAQYADDYDESSDPYAPKPDTLMGAQEQMEVGNRMAEAFVQSRTESTNMDNNGDEEKSDLEKPEEAQGENTEKVSSDEVTDEESNESSKPQALRRSLIQFTDLLVHTATAPLSENVDGSSGDDEEVDNSDDQNVGHRGSEEESNQKPQVVKPKIVEPNPNLMTELAEEVKSHPEKEAASQSVRKPTFINYDNED